LSYGGEKFKYLRALAAFYIRLTYMPKEVYELLEPLLSDYRKLRRKTRFGGTTLTYVDEFVDGLLTKDRMCSTTLYKMQTRTMLEDLDQLEPRVSPLGDIDDLLESDPEELEGNGNENGNGHSQGSERSSSESGRATPNGMDVDDET
jgi:pre-mRNA-splicing factor 38A